MGKKEIHLYLICRRWSICVTDVIICKWAGWVHGWVEACANGRVREKERERDRQREREG